MVTWCLPLGLTTWVLPNSKGLLVVLAPALVSSKFNANNPPKYQSKNLWKSYINPRTKFVTRSKGAASIAHLISQKKKQLVEIPPHSCNARQCTAMDGFVCAAVEKQARDPYLYTFLSNGIWTKKPMIPNPPIQALLLRKAYTTLLERQTRSTSIGEDKRKEKKLFFFCLQVKRFYEQRINTWTEPLS